MVMEDLHFLFKKLPNRCLQDIILIFSPIVVTILIAIAFLTFDGQVYYKYKAKKEPDRYSQCVICKDYNSHKYMSGFGDVWACDERCYPELRRRKMELSAMEHRYQKFEEVKRLVH